MFQAKELVEANLYATEEAVHQDALRALLQHKPQLRVALAAYRYQHENLSVAKAAALAGVSFDDMKTLLTERNIPLRFGPANVAEAQQELADARAMLA